MLRSRQSIITGKSPPCHVLCYALPSYPSSSLPPFSPPPSHPKEKYALHITPHTTHTRTPPPPLPAYPIQLANTLPHNRGVITGTTLSLRTIGGFHGYAILQTIFRHSFHSSLEALLRSIPRLPAARSAQAAELVATIATSSTPATVLADLRRLAASLDLGDVGDVDLPGEGRKLLMHSYQEVWLGAVWFALAAGAVYLVGCYFWRTRRGEAKKKRRDGDRNGNATGNANGNANAAANRNARDTRSPRRMGLCVSGLIFTGLLLLYVFLILMLYLTFPEGGERTRADGSRPSLGAANGSAVVPLFRGSGRGRW